MLVMMINHFRINGLQADIQMLYGANVNLATRLARIEKAETAPEQSLMRPRRESGSSLKNDVLPDGVSKNPIVPNDDAGDLSVCASSAGGPYAGRKCDTVYVAAVVCIPATLCMVACRVYMIRPDSRLASERTASRGSASEGVDGGDDAKG